MRLIRRKWTTIAAAAGLGLALALPAAAQTRPQTPAPPQPKRPEPQLGQQQQSKVDVSDKEVKQFADIYLQSRKIRGKYAKQYQSAENKKEQQKIRTEMGQEMRQVIKDSPLTMERYREIGSATQKNPKLRQRILTQVQAAK